MNQLSSNENSVGESGKWPRTRLRAIALAVLAGVGLYLCYRLAFPCIPSLAWAGALALVFTPMHRWIEAKVRKANLAAVLSLAIIGLLVVAPATWFAQRLAGEAVSVSQSIQKQIAAGKWHMNGEGHPHVAHFLGWVERQVVLPENASMATNWLKTFISKLIKESALVAVQLCLMLYFLFYLLRDRIAVLKAIRSFLPLSESETDTLFSRVNDTVHATLYGMLALSLLQGLLGGLMYCWLGIPSPWLWALVMAVFAFVPVVDAVVLWLPAAIYLGLEGRWGEAFGVAALGTLLVRVVENVLYPVVVKGQVKAHPVSIFVALLGGLVLFGWSGLVLGPVVLTVTTMLLEICASRIGKVPAECGVQPAQGCNSVNPERAEQMSLSGVADLPLKPSGL